jgi:uncharacterized protein (DUF1800 family)
MRFGLGPRRNQDATLWNTPYAAYDQCIYELDAPAAATINGIDMDPAGENVRLLLNRGETGVLANGQIAVAHNFAQEQRARYAKHLLYRVGFVERMVMFWLNHFNMCLSNPTVTSGAGLVERHVIRANTLGRFETMLLGVCQSIPMLTYLNGRDSTNNNTNQNFAREILELHTVGSSRDYSADRDVEAAPNYTQADVVSLAKILTGWSIPGTNSRFQVPEHLLACPRAGTFGFWPQNHAPGPQTVLGKTYPDNGIEQGIAVLKDLAGNPLTAQHIAHRMLCHFVSDTPSGAAVQTLAQTFTSTNGNLKEVTRALLNLEEAWTTPLDRIRQPYPWFISMMRALGIPHLALTNVVARTDVTFQDFIDGNGGFLLALGQKPWTWRTPDGFPDRNDYWMNGNALRLRASVAYSFLQRLKTFPKGTGMTMVTTKEGVPDGSKIQDGTLLKPVPQTRFFPWWVLPEPVNLLNHSLGGSVSEATRTAVLTAAKTDKQAALALLFTSPEYLLA